MAYVSGLSFAYRRGAVPVLSGLDHTFAAGRVTAVSGRSGTGKSTLLYLLGLLLRPTAGEIIVDGLPTSRLPDAQRSRLRSQRIGFVFQDASLDPTRTVLDNVCEPAVYAGVSKSWAVDRAQDLLARVGVEIRADHRPGAVSGGQAQRVAVCRALLLSPRLVLADEPTGNLDTESAAAVIDSLAVAAADGAAVVIATHDPHVRDRADDHVTF